MPKIKTKPRLTRKKETAVFVIYPNNLTSDENKVMIKGRIFETGSLPDLARIQRNPTGEPKGRKLWETRGPFTIPEAKKKVIKAANRQKKAGRQLRVIRGF